MNRNSRLTAIWSAAALAAISAAAFSEGAQIMMRVGADSTILNQYLNSPNSYPVCKSSMNYICLDQTLTSDKLGIFDTKDAFFVVGTYEVGKEFNAASTISRVRDYEAVNRNVAAIWMYRENWINGDTGGPFPVDRRILNQREIDDHRSAVANASPALKCKDTVKLVQLMGGRTFNQDGDSWFRMSDEQKDYVAQFDGIGTECHIGDWDPAGIADGQRTLKAMADMTKWAQDNGKIAFVFMGGDPATYENLPSAQKTYHYLWAEMMAKGVDYKSDHITYFRQGARAGKHTPESAADTLTHQQKWLVESAGTPQPAIRVIANQTAAKNSLTGPLPFTLGAEFLVAYAEPVLTAFSSNPTLLPNANITLGGTGANRTISLAPSANQTGTTTISITATIAPFSFTQTFDLTVSEPTLHVAAQTGTLGDPATWNGVSPVAGDRNRWQSGAQSLRMATSTETFHGDTLEIQAGGEFRPNVATATLALGQLALDGGEITVANNGGLTMDLRGRRLTLNAGTVRAGGTNNSRDIRFKNGVLAGSGTINVSAVAAAGSEVDFDSTNDTRGFTGTFSITDNGILNLPPIPLEKASFGISLSGTGTYANDAAVAVTSLTVGGTTHTSGTFGHADFPSYFLNNGGTVTVTANLPPTVGTVANQTIAEDGTTAALPFLIGDDLSAPDSLVVQAFSSNTALVPDTNLILSGSGSTRALTVQPKPNASGSATVTLRVSDGVSSVLSTFLVTVTAANDPPFIDPINNLLTDGSSASVVPFAIGDPETAAASLVVSRASSNTALVPAANIVLGGSGASRTATITPVASVTGQTTITLTVSDGALSTTSSFVYSVWQGVAPIVAFTNGLITNGSTWTTGAAPAKGDSHVWRTGTKTITQGGIQHVQFHGHELEVQAGGTFTPERAAAQIQMNHLTLSGGTISTNFNNGWDIDLTGDTFTLNSGTLKTGSSGGRYVGFNNGSLAGSGTIDIIGSGTNLSNGSDIRFEPGLRTHGFYGTFNVHSYGVLNLPPATGEASFGIILSGTGRYRNDANIVVRSLVIDGTSFGPGTYTYNSFTTAQKAFLFDEGGTITVSVPSTDPPAIGTVADQTTPEGTPTAPIPFTVSGGANVANLTVTASSPNTTLVPNGSFVFGGSGANRTLVITPAPNQTGTAGIELVVSDGTLTASTLFSLTVTPIPRFINAVANGSLSAVSTWSEAAPLPGDVNIWRSGGYILDMKDGATQTFHGDTLVLQTGGQLVPGIAGANLSLNNLVLDGGKIYMGNNLGLNIDLTGHALTLNSGTLQSGLNGSNRAVRILNGSLAGQGTIDITGIAANSAKVLFQDTITTTGFSGLFNVSSNGLLDLPPVAEASFGLAISGTGRYWNDAAVFVTSLTIAGQPFPAGTYTYANIGAAYQPYLLDNGGSITVVASSDPYVQWAAALNLAGSKTDDDDDDGLANLIEYALGGNPVDSADRGHVPTLAVDQDGFSYTHAKLSGSDPGVGYILQVSEDLAESGWVTADSVITDVDPLDEDFDLITHRVTTPLKPRQFIRLLLK
jgi:hypothetical protein